MLLQFTWDAVDGQVLVVEMEVAGLDLLEHLVAKLTNEAVIVLALDMDNEFLVAGLSALGQSHHFLKANVSLEDTVLDIGDLVGSEEKISGLFHAESVVLEHLAGEDNVF